MKDAKHHLLKFINANKKALSGLELPPDFIQNIWSDGFIVGQNIDRWNKEEENKNPDMSNVLEFKPRKVY